MGSTGPRSLKQESYMFEITMLVSAALVGPFAIDGLCKWIAEVLS